MLKKVLFICSMGKNRSQTASEYFSARFNTRYLGLYAQMILDIENELKWADLIVVFEKNHLNTLIEYYPSILDNKQVINLEIPDIYQKNQKELVEVIKSKESIITGFLP